MGLKSKVKGAARKVKGAVDEKRYAKQVTAANRVIAGWEKIITDGYGEMARVEKNATTLEAKIDAILKVASRGNLSKGESDKLSTQIKVMQNAVASNYAEVKKIESEVNNRMLSSTRNPGKEMIAKGVITGTSDPAEPTVTKITMKTIKPLGYRISGLQKEAKALTLRFKSLAKKIDTADGLLGSSAQKTDKLIAMVTGQLKKLMQYANAVDRNIKDPGSKQSFIDRVIENRSTDPQIIIMIQHQYDEFVNTARECNEAVSRIDAEFGRIRAQIPAEVAGDTRIAKGLSLTEGAVGKISTSLQQRGKTAQNMRQGMRGNRYFKSTGIKMT